MPVTRRQAAEKHIDVSGDVLDSVAGKKHDLDSKESEQKSKARKPSSTAGRRKSSATTQKPASSSKQTSKDKPASKASPPKIDRHETDTAHKTNIGDDSAPRTETIERGHIYFFYRPKVMHEEAHSPDDVKNLHMLLVPRPPTFSAAETSKSGTAKSEANEDDMTVLKEGADAIPAPPEQTKNKKYRLITIGKKQLPDPEKTGGRKDTFWATVTSVGDDLNNLEKGLGEKTYETKTRGTRHEEPARLAGRGAYALVNSQGRTPSSHETHLGYHISHPTDIGDVQTALRIYTSSSFVVQVKNPEAPNTGSAMQGGGGKGTEYPEHIMTEVFGKGGRKGRESYGLRFSSVVTPELLDYEGAQLLLIAARDGEAGLEISLGEGRGEALAETEKKEALAPVNKVFEELGLDMEIHPIEPMKGDWI